MVKTFYVLALALFGAFAPQIFGFSTSTGANKLLGGMNFNTERLSIFLRF